MFCLSKNLCIWNYKVFHRRCVDVCCCTLSQHDIWMGNCSTVVPNFVETYVDVKWRRERRSKCRHQQQQLRTMKKENLSISGGILFGQRSLGTIIDDDCSMQLKYFHKMMSKVPSLSPRRTPMARESTLLLYMPKKVNEINRRLTCTRDTHKNKQASGQRKRRVCSMLINTWNNLWNK